MAHGLERANSEYEYMNQAAVSGTPFTMAARFNTTDTVNNQVIMSIANSGSDVNLFSILAGGAGPGDPAYIGVYAGGATYTPTVNGYSSGVWHHICGVFAAADDRTIVLDGDWANRGTSAVLRTPSGVNKTAIGVNCRQTLQWYMNGKIAEAAIWDAALTEAEIAILAKGYSPLFVHPRNLVEYWHLIVLNPRSRTSGNALTAVGTVSREPHPGMIYPASVQISKFGGISIRVYRGQDGDIDYDSIQAVMKPADSQVSIPNQDLPANTIWQYIRRQVTGCGLESQDSPACSVIIDSNGDMIGITPNPPLNLSIEGVAGGKLKLRWRYTPLSEEVKPTGFKIYMDSGSGFDFGSPTATVYYGLGGSGEFDWTSDALTDGQLYRFCVRSYRSSGGESQNTNYVAAVADDTGPNAITGLRASWQEK